MAYDREASPSPPRRSRSTAAPSAMAQPATISQPVGGAVGRRLTLSPLIRSTLDAAADRRKQRRRLVSTLILAQLLIALAVSIGYVGSRASLPTLVALVAAVIIYLAAFIVNSVLHHPTTATYILVIGGAAAVTGHVITTAVTGQPVDTAQAALFYLAMVPGIWAVARV